MEHPILAPEIQAYLERLVPARPAELAAMEEYARRKNFPIIGPVCGFLCYQVACLIGARRVFELGSGYGYSTAWFARAVQENGGGEVHHVVWDEDLSLRARDHLQALGFADIVRYSVGEAVSTLSETEGTFDIIFNDIDKPGYPGSLPVIKQKLRRGGVLIVDNMLWSGRIFDPSDQSESTEAIREFTHTIKADGDWLCSIIPIRDGLLLATKQV
jgi:predicted O-methyltransferase YrrM